MKPELKKYLDHRKGFALPLHRTPWWLRWRGPWRVLVERRAPIISWFATIPMSRYGWLYVSRADYREIFGRESI
jgi:hypothetical protein